MYKYYSNENYFLDALKNRRLYFNSFRNYNDPYEIFSFIKNIDDGASLVERELKDQTKCCCFSQVNNEYLIWSHYGKEHKGFCIEFDFSKYIIKSPMNGVDTIQYKNNVLFGFLVKYMPYELELSMSKIKKTLTFEQGIELVKHKYECWSYEREYRFIIFKENECFIDIPNDVIKSVTYGFNISDSRMRYLDKRIRNLGYSIETQKLSLISNLGILK